MSKRQLIYESEHLAAYGNERGLALVFKGDPAVVQRHEIWHEALGRKMRVAADVTVTYVRSIALLRGRGVLIQYVNPSPHYVAYIDPDTSPVAQWTATGLEQLPDSKPMSIQHLYPGQTLWRRSSYMLPSLLRLNMFQVHNDIASSSTVQPQQIDLMPGEVYVPSGAVSVEYKNTDVGDAIDVYLSTLSSSYELYPHQSDKTEGFNQLMDCITIRLAPRDPRGYNPMGYNDYWQMLRDPSWRKVMIRGGAVDLVEYITGTRSRQMMRMLMPELFRDEHIQNTSSAFAGYTVTYTYYSSGVRLDTSFFEMRSLLRSLSVDHRIRFMRLYLKNRNLPDCNAIVAGFNRNHGHDYWESIKEFFTLGDHTKILNKIEEQIADYEVRIGQPVPIGFAAHNPPLSNVFDAIYDTGSQLLRWRRAKLNKRQEKFFPHGIKIKKWQTIQEIHDDVSKQANKLEGLSQLQHMPWDEKTMILHGAKCGEVTLLLPRTNLALVRWGKAQGHCVGSMYNQSMQRGECQIVGVFIGGKLKYCIRLAIKRLPTEGHVTPENMITVWYLAEFRGEGNCWPEARYAALAVRALMAHGILDGEWSKSQNGYGRSKEQDWDTKFEQAFKDVPPPQVVSPAVKVRNFTPTDRRAPEPEKLNVLIQGGVG